MCKANGLTSKRAKGNDIIINWCHLRQSAFRIDFFDADIQIPAPSPERLIELASRLRGRGKEKRGVFRP